MIGLDAAELGFIEAHRASLPNLRRVTATGALRRLGSTAGVLPGSVWPTFATGSSPGAHGVYHHLQWDPHAMRIRRVAPDWLDWEPFWYALARRGLRVAAVDVPMTFPPRPRDGIEVVNWGSHDQLGPFAAAPRALARAIRRRFGRHPMGYEIPVGKTRPEFERIRKKLVAGARRKGALVRWLLDSQDWDFFLAVFGETHRGGHILWPDAAARELVPPGALLEVYQAVDQGLGEVLAGLAAETTTLVVFSLHGMGANTSQEHFVPRIMDRVNARFEGGAPGAAAGPPPAQRSLVRLLRERVPARLQNWIARAVPVAVRDLVVSRQVGAGYDWERTPGLALLADLNGYLRLNVRGREARGMLEPGSERLARYLEWLRRCLLDLRVAESGAPLVREVLHTAEVFPGERSGHLPDVVVTWTGAPPATAVRSDALGDITAELATGRGGNHRSSGFCVVLAPEAERAPMTPPEHIADLAGAVTRWLAS